MRSSLRRRLLFTFFVLFVVIGSGTLFVLERALASDLVTALDARLTEQGQAVAQWLATPSDPARLATQLGAVIATRITIVAADGTIEGDSTEPALIGTRIGDAPEIARARGGDRGRIVRALRAGEPPQYLVATPAAGGRVIRLAVPLGEIAQTRATMRNRLLAATGFALLVALVLAYLFVRAVVRPLQSMRRTAERLAAGDYDAPPPTDAGGELGILARAITHLTQEVKSRVGELTEQRDLLSVVVGGLVEGVVVVDRAGAVVLVNEIARPLVGDAAIPEPLAALVELAQGGEPADAELELRGRTVRASARRLSAPTSGTSAEAPGSIIVLYDVTRLRALESVRREFLSNAAHELRTPVTSISGYAETLLGGAVDADTSREFLQTIHRNSQRIAALVNDLLVLDQLGGRDAAIGERTSVALAQVAADAARTAKGVTPSARIEVDVAPDLAVLGTRDGLDHVIQNLVDNAVKYGGGTPVVVRAEHVEREASASGTMGAGRMRVSVRDSGAGIPAGHEDRVFERFYRLDSGRSRDQGGSGLGLAIVKSHVEAMGGRVWVEQAVPGARFVVELDVA